jgi:hypothetical protein
LAGRESRIPVTTFKGDKKKSNSNERVSARCPQVQPTTNGEPLFSNELLNVLMEQAEESRTMHKMNKWQNQNFSKGSSSNEHSSL